MRVWAKGLKASSSAISAAVRKPPGKGRGHGTRAGGAFGTTLSKPQKKTQKALAPKEKLLDAGVAGTTGHREAVPGFQRQQEQEAGTQSA